MSRRHRAAVPVVEVAPRVREAHVADEGQAARDGRDGRPDERAGRDVAAQLRLRVLHLHVVRAALRRGPHGPRNRDLDGARARRAGGGGGASCGACGKYASTCLVNMTSM